MANTYVALIAQAYRAKITAVEFAKYKTNLDKLFAHKINGTAISALEDAVDFNASISCKAHNTANITIADITWTNLTFNTEGWDTDAMHTTGGSNQNFTVPKAGKYLVRASVYWTGNATGLRQIRVTQGGTQMGEVATLPGQATAFSQNYIDVVNCAASDVLVFQVWQNRGGTLDVIQVGTYGISASVTFLGV